MDGEKQVEGLITKGIRYGLAALGGAAVSKGWISQDVSDSVIATVAAKAVEVTPLAAAFLWSTVLDSLAPRIKKLF